MPDRYLLESGAPDGYLLEDGSGVLLLEDSAPLGLYDQPISARKLSSLSAYAISLFSLVYAEPLILDDVIPVAGSSDVLQQRTVQYQDLAFVQQAFVAPEAPIPIDAWETKSPLAPVRRKADRTLLSLPLTIPGVETFNIASPTLQRIFRPQQTTPEWLFFEAAPAVVLALDKWETRSPVPPRWLTEAEGFLSWDVGVFVAPPEPPEPPEPEPPPPRRFKPMHVLVQHLRRPPGGFNTIYYVDDDDA